MDGIKIVDGTGHLGWEDLGDILGLPYDYTITGNVLEIELRHVAAIVAAHVPKGIFIRNVAARLRALPHVVKVQVAGTTITVEFELPVVVD